MTRKDYEMIARVIGEVRGNHDVGTSGPVFAELIAELGAELKRDNPRFDLARFRVAIITYEATRRKFIATHQRVSA